MHAEKSGNRSYNEMHTISVFSTPHPHPQENPTNLREHFLGGWGWEDSNDIFAMSRTQKQNQQTKGTVAANSLPLH